MHPVVWFSWMVLAMYGTITGHSSYWYPSKIFFYHVFHHSHNVGNFGTTGFLDKFFGTDQAWRRYKKIVGDDNRAIFHQNNNNNAGNKDSGESASMMATDPEILSRLSVALAKQNNIKKAPRSSSASSAGGKKKQTSSTSRKRSSSMNSKKKH